MIGDFGRIISRIFSSFTKDNGYLSSAFLRIIGIMKKNDFWLNQSDGYSSLETSSWNKTLHPQIVDRVNQRMPKTYLDFGCGDAKLDHFLYPDIPISIYDISQGMLDTAEENLGEKLFKRYNHIDEIPDNHFDVIVSSLMLMCIDNYEEFKATITKIYNSLSPGGLAIIALTHPCFRQYPFSDFQSEFTQKPFDYFDEGAAFEVEIVDSKSEIKFVDFHWSLGLTINTLIECGHIIKSLHEFPDDKNAKGANMMFAPYVMICTGKAG